MGLEQIITIIALTPLMIYATIVMVFTVSKIFYFVFKSSKIPRAEKDIIIFINFVMFLLFSAWFYWGLSILTGVL